MNQSCWNNPPHPLKIFASQNSQYRDSPWTIPQSSNTFAKVRNCAWDMIPYWVIDLMIAGSLLDHCKKIAKRLLVYTRRQHQTKSQIILRIWHRATQNWFVFVKAERQIHHFSNLATFQMSSTTLWKERSISLNCERTCVFCHLSEGKVCVCACAYVCFVDSIFYLMSFDHARCDHCDFEDDF